MIELLLGAERLLAEGDLDRAEHLFAQVAEADPRNAIAVVGLARVAQARGDTAAALEMAQRALAIDPEDAAARQLARDLLTASEPERATVSDLERTRVDLAAGAHLAAGVDLVAGADAAGPRRSIFARLKALLGFGG